MFLRSLRLLAFLVLTVQPLLYAETVSVNAVLDKQSAHVGEEIYLTIRVTGSNTNVQAPRLPTFQGFDTYYTGRASHLTFINNQSTTKVEFNYVLIPQAPGQFTLNPIQVGIGSQVFQTEPLSVEVTGSVGANSPAPYQQVPPTAPVGSPPGYVQEPTEAVEVDDDNIFIKAWVDKTKVYPNEQILLTYSLYTRYDTRYEGFAEEPEMSGFWIEEFPMGQDIKRETVNVNGKRYVKADIRKIALFPTATAQYTIQPGSIKVSVRQDPQAHSIFDEFFSDSFFSGSGFFSRRENRLLKPEPIQVSVKAFPDVGKPEGFQGAVGNFSISALLDKQAVKQNEPVTMTINIEGEGNLDTLKSPALPELKSFKIYEADSSIQLFKTGNVMAGRKTFEIVFIPTESGDVKIPTLSFNYFNPQNMQYQTLPTPEFHLKVTPSDKPFEIPKNLSSQDIFKKNIEVQAKDIHYIQEKLPAPLGFAVAAFLFQALLVLDGLLTLFFVVFWLRSRREKQFNRDSALKRRIYAKAIAEARIRALKVKRLKEQDLSAYFEEVDKILTQYLSDKFNLSAYGTTRADIERELEESLGGQDPLYQSVLEVYRICDESRFGRQNLPERLKEDVLKILKEIILRLEKVKKKR